ncbi:MAG: FumA C-terminus/TtdB family hydratase beta subunit [Thermoplasmatota archaeon]
MNIQLKIPVTYEELSELSVGDSVSLSGRLCTVRDEAHHILLKTTHKKLPLKIDDNAIYHCGPLMKKNNNQWKVISAGPTTSSRMEAFQVDFLKKFPHINVIVGKGNIGEKTKKALKHRGVYLVYTGGAGALAADQIKKVIDVFWLEELGMAEAVWLFEVKDFGPLIVAIDSHGKSIFDR